MSLNKLAIIQARMSSSRLPGKVLMDIAGQPMLQHVIERTRLTGKIDGILVATTTDPTDDILEGFCRQHNVACFRGSLPDVLDRFYQAALRSHAEVIIRLTADCPLIDPEVIDLAVSVFLNEPLVKTRENSSQLPIDYSLSAFPYDFLANRLPPPWKRSLPIGLDVEVCSFDALERAWKEAHQDYQREHVMPYIYEGVTFPPVDFPADSEWYLEKSASTYGFQVGLLNHVPDYGSLRWTVDTPEDLEFVRQVHHHFTGQPDFGWKDVLSLLQREPGLATINSQVKHKSAFDVDPQTHHS